MQRIIPVKKFQNGNKYGCKLEHYDVDTDEWILNNDLHVMCSWLGKADVTLQPSSVEEAESALAIVNEHAYRTPDIISLNASAVDVLEIPRAGLYSISKLGGEEQEYPPVIYTDNSVKIDLTAYLGNIVLYLGVLSETPYIVADFVEDVLTHPATEFVIGIDGGDGILDRSWLGIQYTDASTLLTFAEGYAKDCTLLTVPAIFATYYRSEIEGSVMFNSIGHVSLIDISGLLTTEKYKTLGNGTVIPIPAPAQYISFIHSPWIRPQRAMFITSGTPKKPKTPLAADIVKYIADTINSYKLPTNVTVLTKFSETGGYVHYNNERVCLKSELDAVFEDFDFSDIIDVSHNHDDRYAFKNHTHDYTAVFAAIDHTHTGYAAAAHTHAGVYATITHNHDGTYAAVVHSHDGTYAAVVHDHAGVYSPTNHDHATTYAAIAHTHAGTYAALVHDHTATYAPISHLHEMSNINGLVAALADKASISYVQSEVANIVGAAPDALNALYELSAAIGDDPDFAATIATQLAGKAAIDHNHDLVYAGIVHSHTGVYSPVSHNHDTIYAGIAHDHNGVYSVVSHNHDSAYAATDHNHTGIYAVADHNHDGVYSVASHDHDGTYAAAAHNHDGTYAPESHNHVIADITDLTDYPTSVIACAYDAGLAVGKFVYFGDNAGTITAYAADRATNRAEGIIVKISGSTAYVAKYALVAITTGFDPDTVLYLGSAGDYSDTVPAGGSGELLQIVGEVKNAACVFINIQYGGIVI